MPIFGQVVIGPPGSGKSTYCHKLAQLFEEIERPYTIINLDPGNDSLPYTCLIDVRDLISLEKTMEEFDLGPNGALIHCIEHLAAHPEWLIHRIRERSKTYLVFDLPGQVEVYTHNTAIQRLVRKLSLDCDMKLAAVHLMDSIFCVEPSKFLHGLLVGLNGQLLLGLPFINLLSKLDTLGRDNRDLVYRLKLLSDSAPMAQLLKSIEAGSPLSSHPLSAKYTKLTRELCEFVDDFRPNRYRPLDYSSDQNLLTALYHIDIANTLLHCEEISHYDPASVLRHFDEQIRQCLDPALEWAIDEDDQE